MNINYGNNGNNGNNGSIKRPAPSSSSENSEPVKKVISNKYISKNTYSFTDMIQNKFPNKYEQDEGGGGGVPNLNPPPNLGPDLRITNNYVDAGGGGGGGLPVDAVGVLGDTQSDLYNTERNITEFVKNLPNQILVDEDEQKNIEELETEITNNESGFIPNLICNASSNANVSTSNARASIKASTSSSSSKASFNTTQDNCIQAISLRKSTSMISAQCHGSRLAVKKIEDLLNIIFNYNKAIVDEWLDVITKSLHCMYLIGGFPGMSTISTCNLQSEGHREAMHISFLTMIAITLADYRKGVYSLMAKLHMLCNKYFERLECILVKSYKSNVDPSDANEVAGLRAAECHGPITTERHIVTRNAIGNLGFNCYTEKVYKWLKKIHNSSKTPGNEQLKDEITSLLKAGDIFSTIGTGGATKPGEQSQTTRRPPLAFILEIGKDGVNYSDISSFDNAVNYIPFYQENDSTPSNSSWKSMVSSFISNLMSYASLNSNPLKQFKQLVERNILFLKQITLEMIGQWNAIFVSQKLLKVQQFEVVDDTTPFSFGIGYKFKEHQILMSSEKYKIIKNIYYSDLGGRKVNSNINDLNNEIKSDIEKKIAFAPSLFFYLIDCMFTDFMFLLIDEFRKDNNVSQFSINQLQRTIRGRFCSDTLSALKWCVENCRSINGDYSCQISFFETPKQITDARYDEEHNTSYTQDAAFGLFPEESSEDYSKGLEKTVYTVKKSGFTKPAGGGRMIRNNLSVRNRVTRKRQRQKTKKIQEQIRRTTRKQRRQGKRRRTKKRN